MAAATSAAAAAVVRVVVMAAVLLGAVSLSSATTVSHDGRSLVIDGVRRIILSGSIHYPRSTPEMWPELIEKAKLGGLDAIETYVFWNAHEPQPRQYNFEGNLDLVRFVKEVQHAGLYAILRIGPYVCAEWNYGGFPAWLRAIPGLQMRTDNEQFKTEMQTFTALIVDMMREEKLFAPLGGPIILAQIENEYGNVMDEYGDAGKRYIGWCANMAVSLDIGLPWIMCQQADAPHPIINTCNGFYCDDFEPNNPNSPKMWTENWTGWFKAWDKADPHRPAEDVAYAVARFFERGGTLQNYYMYHGGTNFGRTSGGPYITTTYDYDAPLDEYGNLNQPKWGHLKELHHALKSMEEVLTQGEMTNQTLGDGVTFTKYSTKYAAGCFISNTNQSTDAKVTLEGRQYLVPAWSVSLLPDCHREVYNTAKVNTQRTILVKKPGVKSSELSWTWKAEDMRGALGGKGDFAKLQLTDQILTSLDASDYLWYMTRVDVPKGEAQMTLRVNTTGHVLYAFVNGRLVGSKYASNGDFMFVLESQVALRPGKNHISLLSATVGLKNYGPQFELMPTGIVGGPVQLVRNEDNHTMDLSTNEWSYKIGLKGEEERLYRRDARSTSEWLPGNVPTNRPFTWYKTTFDAPLGAEPVVADLLGMGKGEAWVNGRSIGRFWPVSAATSGHCGHCDYRVVYDADDSECRTGCSGPAQRWYHVPRSFLEAGGENVLVLFEEAGGDPSRVNFQTVTRQST